MSNENKKAVVLLSGGLDSATILAIAGEMGYKCYAMTFRYGQRHSIELKAAKRVSEAYGVKKHMLIDIDLAGIGGSALTDNIDVPKGRDMGRISNEIPVTYVPARNTVFLSYALAWAEVLGANDIYLGVNAVDYSGYPDCRPEFLAAYEQMASLATKAGVEGRFLMIHAPLIAWTKARIIQEGTELGVDYSLTLSCYDPNEAGEACGRCASCTLRRKGFDEAKIEDPTRYQE